MRAVFAEPCVLHFAFARCCLAFCALALEMESVFSVVFPSSLSNVIQRQKGVLSCLRQCDLQSSLYTLDTDGYQRHFEFILHSLVNLKVNAVSQVLAASVSYSDMLQFSCLIVVNN
jgi:hypothetical protein